MKIIIAIDAGKAFLKESDFPLMIVGIIVNFVPAILYLIGARRNRPAGEQIEVESRWQENGETFFFKGIVYESIIENIKKECA